MAAMRSRQSGVVLLGLMIVLLLASGYFVLNQANHPSSRQAREAKTIATLLQARDALLASAVTDDNRPGSLPCPATSSDGNSVGFPNSPCPSYVGWLPWRFLDLPDLRDDSGERLWYVLSPPFQDGNNLIINSTTASTLTLNGNGGIAALIIAPGAALAGQNRPSNNAADYLDDRDANPLTSNRDGDSNYFSGPTSDSFNDKVIALDTQTLFSAVSKRILGEIRYAYFGGGGALPDADNNNDGISDIGINIGGFPYNNLAYSVINSTSWKQHMWFESLKKNNWFPLITYDRLARRVSLNGQNVPLP